MKKLLAVVIGLMLATSLTLNAQDAPAKKGKKALTEEQQKLQKEMLGKYDADKNGRLSQEERAKFTPEEKAAWEKAFPARKKKAQ